MRRPAFEKIGEEKHLIPGKSERRGGGREGERRPRGIRKHNSPRWAAQRGFRGEVQIHSTEKKIENALIEPGGSQK